MRECETCGVLRGEVSRLSQRWASEVMSGVRTWDALDRIAAGLVNDPVAFARSVMDREDRNE